MRISPFKKSTTEASFAPKVTSKNQVSQPKLDYEINTTEGDEEQYRMHQARIEMY
jgi:hypothetical protein